MFGNLLNIALHSFLAISKANCWALARTGFDNSMYGIYSDISGKDSALFTTVHGVFSFFRGLGVFSIGPLGAAIIRVSPDVQLTDYGIGKYKASAVIYSSTMSGHLILLLVPHYLLWSIVFSKRTSLSCALGSEALQSMG